MIFPYRPWIAVSPDTGDGVILLRPEIEIVVHGSAGSHTVSAIVDTGADLTVFPLSIAQAVGIDVSPSDEPAAIDFSGQALSFQQGEAELELISLDQQESLRWRTQIQFFDFGESEDESVVLGHAGFPNYFTAEFNGKDATLELVANDTLPSVAPDS